MCNGKTRYLSGHSPIPSIQSSNFSWEKHCQARELVYIKLVCAAVFRACSRHYRRRQVLTLYIAACESDSTENYTPGALAVHRPQQHRHQPRHPSAATNSSGAAAQSSSRSGLPHILPSQRLCFWKVPGLRKAWQFVQGLSDRPYKERK